MRSEVAWINCTALSEFTVTLTPIPMMSLPLLHFTLITNWKMAKCGPKPRQLTARQLRELVREEKRALALQHSVRQAPQSPPSPRRKRPSQYHVSLAKKRRVKTSSPLRPALRRVRTESSIALSAV